MHGALGYLARIFNQQQFGESHLRQRCLTFWNCWAPQLLKIAHLLRYHKMGISNSSSHFRKCWLWFLVLQHSGSIHRYCLCQEICSFFGAHWICCTKTVFPPITLDLDLVLFRCTHKNCYPSPSWTTSLFLLSEFLQSNFSCNWASAWSIW